ncbi:MAG: CBS domain-containing protein [Chloroflexi bacterium]|jgi:acetoin utilization protein AcuB|nr:CBS domain-containing protein [Chloroflexota bacterium]MBT3669467.1 CBS domain-containing protein [Chloroflexota bacterium]MBT4003245.1 CBS domain-containing protein [Chloroflexota bacterium]MBT4304514.1 CBS domain-containing protein [Chloroflexota bacterium]MBT4534145.1 CBS domain-containing protein [Chloroflexota bacterium]
MGRKNVFVKDWMTPNPYSANPSMHLSMAEILMKESDIRRLPVVEDGKLIGIVTDGDIREAGPSDVSSLGKYETDFLLSGLKVSDVMTNEPVTVSSGDTIRKLAELMLVRKIGGVPVVDDGELVGIITVSDIFKVILETFED